MYVNTILPKNSKVVSNFSVYLNLSRTENKPLYLYSIMCTIVNNYFKIKSHSNIYVFKTTHYSLNFLSLSGSGYSGVPEHTVTYRARNQSRFDICSLLTTYSDSPYLITCCCILQSSLPISKIGIHNLCKYYRSYE